MPNKKFEVYVFFFWKNTQKPQKAPKAPSFSDFKVTELDWPGTTAGAGSQGALGFSVQDFLQQAGKIGRKNGSLRPTCAPG